MRPQGQLKSDGALPDSSDKSGERASQTGQRWGDADLRPPTTPRPRRELKTKLALGAPPPPAGAAIELPPGNEDESDAVAGLFASDRIVPAPGINDAPSEAEIGRWVATAQTSMFDDRVKDPAPAPAGRAGETQRRPSAPKLAAIEPDEAPLSAMSEPEAMPSRKPRAPAPPPPASPVPAAKRGGSGARKKSASAKAKAAAPEATETRGIEDDAELKPRKRRFERAPSKTVLMLVGVGALLSLGAAAVLIGAVPNPLADAPPTRSAAPRRAAPAKVAAHKAAPVAAAAAVPAAKPASAAAAAPVAGATVAADKPAPVPPAAAKPATVIAAAKPVIAAPAPAKQAAAAPAAAASDESESAADESSGSGSGKLAQARKLLAADNPQAAEALARQVLAGDPSDHHAMDVLARALMDQERGQEALPLARKMVQKRSKRVPYRLLLGDLLLMVGDEAGARAQWQTALELDPGNREIKRRLGK